MGKSTVINTGRKISLFKGILFYFNVTVFRVIKALPTLSDSRNNYHSRTFSVAIITLIEFTILRLLFPQLLNEYLKWFLIVPLIIHGLIDVLFMKDILLMSSDYNTYYSKQLFYFSFIFFAIGLVGSYMLFNDAIGHG